MKKLGKKEYLAQQEKIQQQKDRRAWKAEGPLAMPEVRNKIIRARDEWGQGAPSTGPNPFASPTSGEEGYRDILKDQLGFLDAGYGKNADYSIYDPMRHFTDPEEIRQILKYDLVDAQDPPLKQVPLMRDMLNTSGVPYPTEGRPIPSLLDPVADSANWPEGGVGGGAEAGLSPWKGYSMGTTSYNVPTERDFMVDLTQGYGPEGFQNVVDLDQLAGIRASTGSPDYLAGPQGTFIGDSYEGEWSPTQGAPVEQPQLSPQNRFNDRSWISRIHSPDWDENAATSMNRQPAPENGGLLGSGTGYNKSNRFNNIMAEMLMRSGANRLNRNRNW